MFKNIANKFNMVFGLASIRSAKHEYLRRCCLLIENIIANCYIAFDRIPMTIYVGKSYNMDSIHISSKHVESQVPISFVDHNLHSFLHILKQGAHVYSKNARDGQYLDAPNGQSYATLQSLFVRCFFCSMLNKCVSCCAHTKN